MADQIVQTAVEVSGGQVAEKAAGAVDSHAVALVGTKACGSVDQRVLVEDMANVQVVALAEDIADMSGEGIDLEERHKVAGHSLDLLLLIISIMVQQNFWRDYLLTGWITRHAVWWVACLRRA